MTYLPFCVPGIVVALAAVAPAAEVVQTDLFRAGEQGYFMYRIPGIVVTGRGTILAYCEARTGPGDWTRQDVLLRRSDDGGRTWSAPRKMAVRPPDLKPNPAGVAQGLGTHDDMTAHNAVAIADRQPGVVHFLYHVQYARVFYLRSDDDGLSWSEPREITEVIEGFRERYDWKVVGNGCGHGIQIHEGPHRGRLAVAVWLSTGTGGHAHRPSDVAALYSDDGGQTWQRGDFIARDGQATAAGEKIVYPSETMLVELSGGRVMANVRSESAPHRRLLSVSPDGAAGWSQPESHQELLEPICMAGMVRLADGRILFSNPDNLLVRGEPGRPGRNRDRRNLTVRISSDDGKTWPIARAVDPGPSGYSDLAAAPDGTVYCFFERGAVSGNHFHTEALTLARLPADLSDTGRAAAGAATPPAAKP
ncbi:MAG: sialidase family protein [Thermoguttaceae bacterium]|jgi:sialidase-1|nr:sialidase family protein [Thermoguttaceae bacterium]